jgi:hypothetical protein
MKTAAEKLREAGELRRMAKGYRISASRRMWSKDASMIDIEVTRAQADAWERQAIQLEREAESRA